MKEVAPGILIDFGGHHMAGGFSVEADKVHLLEDELCRAFEKVKESGEGKGQEIFVDKKLSLDDVNWQTYAQIEKLAPFGIGNAKPVFLFENIEIMEMKLFGKERNHLELNFQNSKGKKVSSIAFFSVPEDYQVKIEKGSRINLVATLEKSTFRNFPELRLRIVDIIK